VSEAWTAAKVKKNAIFLLPAHSLLEYYDYICPKKWASN